MVEVGLKSCPNTVGYFVAIMRLLPSGHIWSGRLIFAKDSLHRPCVFFSHQAPEVPSHPVVIVTECAYGIGRLETMNLPL
jgi:hypothetical protein